MTTAPATSSAIVYPETDGLPLPDGEFQAPIYVRIVAILRFHFRNVPGARVNGNTFIYFVEGNPRRSVSPDCYVVLGLSDSAIASIERANTYLLWEVGKAPDFILEIGSKSTGTADTGRKRELYAELGVREYWLYDSTGGEFYGEPLVGERLVDGEYVRMEAHEESDGSLWYHSDVLNLDLWWIEGELRFWDAESVSWLLSYEERYEESVAAESRAAEERARRLTAEARARQERAERLAAESRIAELESELSRLRGK